MLRSAPFGLVSDRRQRRKRSGRVLPSVCERTLCSAAQSLASGALPVRLLNSSGSDDEIFLVEDPGVKSAPFSSPHTFSQKG